MAKKLLATNYSINADSDKITIKGFYRGEQFQLITHSDPNTGGTILFNFADTSRGYKEVTFNEQTEQTTIQLEQDLSSLGLNDSSKIQIIVDHPETEMEVSDALLERCRSEGLPRKSARHSLRFSGFSHPRERPSPFRIL